MSNTEGETEDAPRTTALIKQHRALDARLVDFAGWQMPVWYTSASEEHAAVREAAGLFDIGHMGVLEVAGPEHIEFLDVLTTARADAIDAGRCHYTFLLSPKGLPIDDIILYRLSADRFLAVVNAANADSVWTWLTGVASGRTPLAPDRPDSARRFDVTLRNLQSPDAGSDRLMGMALQGPVSAEVLGELTDSEMDPAAMNRFALAQVEILGCPAIISRTGYTGEAIGYEVFVHPAEAPRIWSAILERGEASGVMAAGLAARDSLRIEAGLPLYGHELDGRHEITPLGAGYARFVETDKQFFVGREALVEREEDREGAIVRFRLNRDGARAIRADDLVGSRRGKMVGWVTSCAPVDDTQMGMAWVDEKLAREGEELLIYPARHLERATDLSDAEALERGDRLPINEPAMVLPRFPK